MLLIPGNSSSQSETRKRIMLLVSTRITCRSDRQLIQSKDREFQVSRERDKAFRAGLSRHQRAAEGTQETAE
jgi:hypothetical protein